MPPRKKNDTIMYGRSHTGATYTHTADGRGGNSCSFSTPEAVLLCAAPSKQRHNHLRKFPNVAMHLHTCSRLAAAKICVPIPQKKKNTTLGSTSYRLTEPARRSRKRPGSRSALRGLRMRASPPLRSFAAMTKRQADSLRPRPRPPPPWRSCPPVSCGGRKRGAAAAAAVQAAAGPRC